MNTDMVNIVSESDTAWIGGRRWGYVNDMNMARTGQVDSNRILLKFQKNMTFPNFMKKT